MKIWRHIWIRCIFYGIATVIGLILNPYLIDSGIRLLVGVILGIIAETISGKFL